MTTQTTAAPLVVDITEPLAVGDLVRFCNERDTAYYGMTGRIETLGNGGATVRLTARAQVRGCLLHELARMPDAAGGK